MLGMWFTGVLKRRGDGPVYAAQEAGLLGKFLGGPSTLGPGWCGMEGMRTQAQTRVMMHAP